MLKNRGARLGTDSSDIGYYGRSRCKLSFASLIGGGRETIRVAHQVVFHGLARVCCNKCRSDHLLDERRQPCIHAVELPLGI